MLCPKCKKKETQVVTTFYENNLNVVKRQRQCECSNLFLTYEINTSELSKKSALIIKKTKNTKKRKLSRREEWIDFRIYLYGIFRIIEMYKSITKVSKKFKTKYKKNKNTVIAVNKLPNRKSYAAAFDIDYKTNEITKFQDVKLINVKKTIEHCISLPIYWKKKKTFFGNTIEIKDFKDLDQRSKLSEINEFNRSVTSYVNKEKYDTDFYLNNVYAKDLIKTGSLFKKDLEELNKVLKFFFSDPKHWLWFTTVR